MTVMRLSARAAASREEALMVFRAVVARLRSYDRYHLHENSIGDAVCSREGVKDAVDIFVMRPITHVYDVGSE